MGKNEARKGVLKKFIYFQIKFESIREVYKEQQQPIFLCFEEIKLGEDGVFYDYLSTPLLL